MIRIKLPDIILLNFLHKTLIGIHPIHHTLFTVNIKLNETLVDLMLAQIQKSIGANGENTLALFRQYIKSADFLCTTFL